MPIIKSVHFNEVVRPLKTVFATALGKKASLQNIIVSVALDNGCIGTGEIPTSFSRRHETVPLMKRVLGEVRQELAGLPVHDYEVHMKHLRGRFPEARMTLSGLEVALFRAFLKNARLSEHAFFGGRNCELETDITIPFVPDEMALTTWIAYGMRKGFSVFKAKVSGNLKEDKRFLSLVCELIGKWEQSFLLRLDGNQGFTVASCLDLIDFTKEKNYPVQVFEQPLQKDDLKGFRTVTRMSPLPIILDESVESVADLRRSIDAGAGHGINVKIAKTGIGESMEIMRLAGTCGLKLMIGCMTETMVGLSAAIYCAAGSASFDYVDVDSIYLLHHRNRYGNIRIEGSKFFIGSRGLGPGS